MTKDRHNRLRRPRPGTAPGTLVVPPDSEPPQMTVMAWDLDNLEEKAITRPEDVLPFLEKWPVVWINIDGLGSTALLEAFGKIFDLHALALEDVLNRPQRPKIDNYETSLFMVMRMARILAGELELEQISLFLGKNFVLTFQERPDGDCLDPVRSRIRYGGRRVRFSHADYLAYAIADAVIDGYFPVLEHYGNILNDLEDEVVANPGEVIVARTHEIKRTLRQLRHSLWPMREMVNGFSSPILLLVREETRPYLRDCHDHVIQVLDILELQREQASGLIDIYLSSISNRTNEIMKVLTMIATIFIPLSFVASLYGMNFDRTYPLNMPELGWEYGYIFALGMMGVIAGGLGLYFRSRGWLPRKK